MKKIILASVLAFVSVKSFAHDEGKISLAKAAELTAHRIDRLVSLKKIDADYLNKLEKIEVSKVENADPVSYRALVSQTQPAQGNPFQVEILSDHDGKALSYKVLEGGSAGPDLQWTEKDAVSLAENSLHYVLDNESNATVAPYFSGLKSVTLSKETQNGQPVAVGTVLSSAQAQKLKVYLKLDGTFISSEVVP